MAISEKSIAGLEKLYEKRKALDKQIMEAEKKLLAEAKTEAKAAAKSAPRAARKPRSPKASV
ncbi:MAG: hypothetical protein LBQ38_07235 [Spirochaetaceae bacterium]|jgi:hypothetical protein|nr:hypothetical protein [Spirochaetaceae bacterium]